MNYSRIHRNMKIARDDSAAKLAFVWFFCCYLPARLFRNFTFNYQAVVKRILSSFFGFIFGFLGLGSIYVRGLASASGLVIGFNVRGKHFYMSRFLPCGSGRYFLVRVRFFLLTCWSTILRL